MNKNSMMKFTPFLALEILLIALIKYVIISIVNSTAINPISKIFRYIKDVWLLPNNTASLKYNIDESNIILLIVEVNELYNNTNRDRNNIVPHVIWSLDVTFWDIVFMYPYSLTIIIRTVITVINNSRGDLVIPFPKVEEKYIGFTKSEKPNNSRRLSQ